jgi:hypothetical protein
VDLSMTGLWSSKEDALSPRRSRIFFEGMVIHFYCIAS